MPWINEEMCTGCGVCLDECPVDAITMDEDTAIINNEECIRCGICHDICPLDAVRHDGEKIPQEIEANLTWAKGLLEHYSTTEEKEDLIERLKRFFEKERKVAVKTIEKLDSLKD